MHIKYVVVEGFRVYRDRIELAPLSPKHNVVGESPDPPRFTPRAPFATAHPSSLRSWCKRGGQVELVQRCVPMPHRAQPARPPHRPRLTLRLTRALFVWQPSSLSSET